MKIIGVVCEYNPFHNGHLYQINKIKEMFPDSIIIITLSTCFSQRGDISILNKWEKTKIALQNNVDIVLELPYFFSSQSADTFAHASIQILNEFKIDTLIFGSETNNIEKLKQIADKSLNNFDKDKIKEYLNKGFNFPTSLYKSISDDEPNLLSNDLLNISYLKEIQKYNYKINPVSIKRTNHYNDLLKDDDIVSASNIRNRFINKKDVSKYIPKETNECLINKNIDYDLLFNLLKYKIISSKNLDKYLDVCEGIENKLIKEIDNSKSYEELISKIKSKRYTYNRINRMLNHILISLKKEDTMSIKNIEYIRILGLSEFGKKYLSKIKKDINYPLIYNHKKKNLISDYELKSTKIYSLITNEKNLLDKEYKKNIII